jgi:hypothetical protein
VSATEPMAVGTRYSALAFRRGGRGEKRMTTSTSATRCYLAEIGSLQSQNDCGRMGETGPTDSCLWV